MREAVRCSYCGHRAPDPNDLTGWTYSATKGWEKCPDCTREHKIIDHAKSKLDPEEQAGV